MPGFSIPDASAFQDIVKAFSKTKECQEVIQEQGGYPTRDRKTLMEIGERFLADVEAGFKASMTSDNMMYAQADASISVGISKKTGTQTINIRFPDAYLFRPSFEKVEPRRETNVHDYRDPKGKWQRTYYYTTYQHPLGEYTGSGINDIFALITSGYSGLKARPYGLWGGPGIVTAAPYPQRQGTPFVPAVVAKYEAMYPDVKIEYPPEWG